MSIFKLAHFSYGNFDRYETKPALSVPIHVVELTNVPPELRLSAAIPEQGEETTKTIPTVVQKKQNWVSDMVVILNQEFNN